MCAVAIKPMITTFVFSFGRKRKKRTRCCISLFLPGADKRKTEMETRPCEIFFLRMLVAVDETFEACIWLICSRIKKNRKLDSGLVFS